MREEQENTAAGVNPLIDNAACTSREGSCACAGSHGPEEGFSLPRRILSLLPGSTVYLLASLIWYDIVPLALSHWSTVSLFAVAYLLIAHDILLNTARNLRRGRVFDEFFLMTLATLGAMAIGAYAEAVAVILFFKTGEMLQETAVSKSRQSITSLLKLDPEQANLEDEGGLYSVDPSTVGVGQIIQVRPGERVPLDGEVLQGRASLDNSALTGESLPVGVEPGSRIFSGAINLSGLLRVRVMKTLASSTISRIQHMVENAQARKSPTEQFITRFARYYTPSVVGAAFFIAVLPVTLYYLFPVTRGLFEQAPLFSDSLYNALVFLVISCPCALVISIPLGFFGGIGAASREGILVKGANFLEGLNKVGAIVWDKTGTLTRGAFQVTAVQPVNGFSREEVLRAAAKTEAFSTHPVALSICQAFSQEKPTQKPDDYTEYPGRGVAATIEGKTVLVGNEQFMLEHGAQPLPPSGPYSAAHVLIDGTYAGAIQVSDSLRSGTLSTVRSLKKQGIEQYLLSGDSEEAVNEYARKLGMDRAYSGLLPQDKVDRLESIQDEAGPGSRVLFVGDGINDAPVLARADIGVAMGGLGSDAAIEAADVVLMQDQPESVLQARQIARKTRFIVWQNIFLALGVKSFFLTLGAMGMATMWEAVFADVGVALLAVLNSIRVISGISSNTLHQTQPSNLHLRAAGQNNA